MSEYGRKEVETMGELKRRAGRRPIKQEVKERVVKLYAANELTIDEICKVCEVSKSSVFRILRERRTENAEGKEV